MIHCSNRRADWPASFWWPCRKCKIRVSLGRSSSCAPIPRRGDGFGGEPPGAFNHLPRPVGQLGVEPALGGNEIRVHFGGPVKSGRGFVLHTAEYNGDGTLPINSGIALTATVDILRDIARGTGPRQRLWLSAMRVGVQVNSMPRSRPMVGCKCRPTNSWCSAVISTASGSRPWRSSVSISAGCRRTRDTPEHHSGRGSGRSPFKSP